MLTLVDVADVDGGEDDVAQRRRRRVDARHRLRAGVLLRVLHQEVGRRRADPDLNMFEWPILEVIE